MIHISSPELPRFIRGAGGTPYVAGASGSCFPQMELPKFVPSLSAQPLCVLLT